MKCFYFFMICVSFLCAEELQVIDDCATEKKQNLIGNSLDLGQKYCDSNKHIQKRDIETKPIEDENLNKFQEFIHSLDCDTRKC